MNGLRKLSLLAVTLLFGAFAAVAQKPNIHILYRLSSCSFYHIINNGTNNNSMTPIIFMK